MFSRRGLLAGVAALIAAPTLSAVPLGTVLSGGKIFIITSPTKWRDLVSGKPFYDDSPAQFDGMIGRLETITIRN